MQVRPRVRQLPAEPGALRGRGLRAAGRHPQEGAPRGPQVVQGHVQRFHLVDEPGREGRQGRGDFGRQVSAAALWGGGSGFSAVLAASPTRGPRWPPGRGCPVLDLCGRVASTCVGGKTEGVPVSVRCGPRSPGPLPCSDSITPPPPPPLPLRLILVTPNRIWQEPPPNPGPLSLSPLWLSEHLTRGSVCPQPPVDAGLPFRTGVHTPHLYKSTFQKPTSSVLTSCSGGLRLVLSSPSGWGWSPPRLLFWVSVFLTATARPGIRASPPPVPGALGRLALPCDCCG